MKKVIKSTVDNSRPASMDRPDYRQYNRLHRERLVNEEHERNVARIQQRAEAGPRLVSQKSPALIARRGGPPGSAMKYLYNADKAMPAHRDLARELGGAEDLVHELGGDSTPLSHLRRPPRPATVCSRVEAVEQDRKKGMVPLSTGLSTRERCILWGTSLADVPALDQEAPHAVVARRRAQSARSRGMDEDEARQGQVVRLTSQNKDALKSIRKRLLDKLLEESWCTEERVLAVVEDTWEKTLVVHRPQLLELLCEIMLQMGLGQMASDFRKRKAPAGSAAAKGSGKGVGIVSGYR